MSYRAIPEYYDAEYEHTEMLQEDVPFFLKHLKRGQSILELAVGTGRAAIPLAQAGHQVVGVDYDQKMLAMAQRKRDSVGLTSKELDLIRGDIQKLNLRRRFDWACILFNTFLVFTSLEDQDRALLAARRHLKRSGKLWIDIFHPNLSLLARPRSRDLEPTMFYVPEFDRTVCRTTEVRPDVANQKQRVIFHYSWFDQFGREMRERREFDLTFIFPRELRMLLERNELRLEKLYGNYDGSELDADSPRMIAVCKP
jgi:ubiquinone/menaquinone biosynthesis C-methylase UbiE